MSDVTVSVIIPTYNGATFLGEAIQSVLNQTYPFFELIIVNDSSPDNTDEIVSQYQDHRLKYIVHKVNSGSDIARSTGLHSSSGEIIAFLDQDDYYHPEKLQAHVTFLKTHLDVGLTYNPRFELNYSANTIRSISVPPKKISLTDLVLGFPIAPSDVVIRREWALELDLPGGTRGAEIYHFGNLFLSGCKFYSIDRALNFRRYHSGRIIKDLSDACKSEINNQVKIFEDPRCPTDVLAVRNTAHANLFMYWSYLAFNQGETELGRDLVRKAVTYKPSVLNGKQCELVKKYMLNCIADENQQHEVHLRYLFNQLPPEMVIPSEQYHWAVSVGYLLKGSLAVIWDRFEDSRYYFKQAAMLQSPIDEYFLRSLTHHLLNFYLEFGADESQNKIDLLKPFLIQLGGQESAQRLMKLYTFNQAFHSYYAREYSVVPRKVIKAFITDPKVLTNRGLLSILFRTTVGRFIS
jgi:glycosyltransferase involved in cell wall biosynthesis